MQLELLFGKKNGLKVIQYLIAHKDWEFNITELAHDTGIHKGALSRIIPELEKKNVIQVKRKGNILLFSINKNHLLMKKCVIPFFENTDAAVIHVLKEKLSSVMDTATFSIVLYGSYATGKATLRSDIDLMIIMKKRHPSLTPQLEKLKNAFLEQDILLRVDMISLSEFKKLYTTGEPLINSIYKHHVILHGNPLP